ncbi:hypothetical protein HDU67_000982 [Dinochytrium kinnereticum]|nr:hypothetical protein HDU67_000982 [Dinochytrium kinnereticum]
MANAQATVTDPAVILNLVNNVLSSLPACSVTCLQQLPGFSTVLTTTFITQLCNDSQNIVTTLTNCIQTACPASQTASARTFIAQIPTLCKQLPTDLPSAQVTLTLPTATSGGPTSAPTSAPATSTKTGDASSFAVSYGSVCAAVGVAFAAQIL